LNRKEFARACAKQQVLELLLCMFIKFGGDFPSDYLCEVGVSKARLMFSDYGHYYSQWVQLKLEQDLFVGKMQDRTKLLNALETHDRQLKEMMASNEMLDRYRKQFDNCYKDTTENFDPTLSSVVVAYEPDRLVGSIISVAQPINVTHDTEGVDVHAAGFVGARVDHSKYALYLVDSCVCVKEHARVEDELGCLVVQPLVAKFEIENILPKREWLKPKGCGEWALSPNSVCEISREHCEAMKNELGYQGSIDFTKWTKPEIRSAVILASGAGPQDIYIDSERVHELTHMLSTVALVHQAALYVKHDGGGQDERVLGVIQLEYINEQALQGQILDDTKPFSLGSFKRAWDVHSMIVSRYYDVVLAVTWKADKLAQIDRVVILNIDGHTLLDKEVAQGPGYNHSLYIARREAHMYLLGSNIYGFNVFQHMSKLGMAGDRSRCVDMCSLPMLKGRSPSLSVEKYQIRYGRALGDLAIRDDPVLDNARFCVFLVRRDGLNWRVRRKRKV